MTSQKNVWIIEDDNLLADLTSQSVSKTGFASQAFRGAIEPLKKLESGQTPPDIILLDIIMPDMDGFKFMTMLNKDEKLKKIPIIIFSNLGDKSEIERGYQLGAEAYFVKANILPQDVVQKVIDVIGRP